MSVATEPPEIHGPAPCDSVVVRGQEVNTVCVSVNRSVRIQVLSLAPAVAARTTPYKCAVQLDVQLQPGPQVKNEALLQHVAAFRQKLEPLNGALLVAIDEESTENASVNQVLAKVRHVYNSFDVDLVELQLVLPSELERQQEPEPLGGGAASSAHFSRTGASHLTPPLTPSDMMLPLPPPLPRAQWAASTTHSTTHLPPPPALPAS